MNKKKLYESIMKQVSKEVKKALNETINVNIPTVDLGLPSGLLWCEYNLGSTHQYYKESWYGNYYAWGETEPKEAYYWETYKHSHSTSLRKYNTDDEHDFELENADNIKRLMPADDAVTVALGSGYRMPTDDEYDELINNTEHEWVKDYQGISGLNGMMFTSLVNHKTLFFPAAGYIDGDSIHKDSICTLYTSAVASWSPSNAYCLYCSEAGNTATTDYRQRAEGRPVRGVKTR